MKRLIRFLTLIVAIPAGAGFVHQRSVTPAGTGPNRLEVDAALLAGAKSDLSDLRLLDASGQEIPYLLIPPPRKDAAWLRVSRLLPIAATKTTSGFEADIGSVRSIDRARLEGIRGPFLKPVRVEGSGDRTRWTLLADSSVFDLPDDRLRNLDVVFSSGSFRYLRFTWDDRSSARVTSVPQVSVREHTSTTPQPLRVSVPFEQRVTALGRSRYRVTLPGMGMPLESIELVVASGDVFRRATVSEPRLEGAQVVPAPLGSAELRRTERGGGVAADLVVPVASPRGRDLDLVIEDGSNPALALRGVIAHFAPQPAIYFESSGTVPLVARYGDPKLNAPRYDLEASRKFAEAAVAPEAMWGATSPPSGPAATTASLPPFGATLDRSKFTHRRAVPNAKGLVVLLLDAEVLSRSNALADVRLVDEKNRQVQYLVERRDEPLVVDLSIPERRESEGRSLYRFTLPYERFPEGTALVLTPATRVFTRPVELRTPANDRRGEVARTLTSTIWSNSEPDVLPPPVSFNTSLGGTVELLLDEGDNAPLELQSARLLIPSSGIRFMHPGSELTLLYGAAIPAPRYDLALLAPRLFSDPARELRLGKPAGPVEARPSRERTFFWIVIGVAAVVLLAMLGRLLAPLRREEPGPLGETPGRSDPPR